MVTPDRSFRRRVGALIVFYDLPAVQVWIAAVALGLGYGLARVGVPWTTWLLALCAMGSLFMYLMAVNDLFDLEIDRQKHEHSGLVTGVISTSEAKVAVLVSGGFGLVASFFVSGWFFVLSFLIFAISTLYSVPPVRFKRFYPFTTLGELAGGYLLFPLGLSIVQTPTLPAFVLSFIPFMIAASMRLGHEVKYVDFDKSTGKRTLAVTHGVEKVKAVVKALPPAAFALTIIAVILQVVSIQLGVLITAFIFLPAIIRKAIRASGHLRPLSYFWGVLFYLIALSIH
jgi:4-hydroxybenzoate polyprenyltransferase